MVVKKKHLLCITLIAFMFLLAGIMLGCGGNNDISHTGNGQVVEKVDEDGNKSYTAIADEWNEFVGWFDGDQLFSSEATITIDENSPKNLTAHFESSGEISIDRFLKSFYSQVNSQQKNDYFNFESAFNVSFKQDNKIEKYILEIYGSLAREGDKHVVLINLKDEQNIQKLSVKIENYGEKTQILLKTEQNEYFYDTPFGFQNIAFAQNSPTLKTILPERIYNEVNKIVGVQNILSFVEDVQNTKTQTNITLSVDSLLNYAKNVILPNVADSDVFVKELLETLTKKYQGLTRQLPSMKLTIVVDYASNGAIQGLRGNYCLDEDYKLELEDTVTIDKFDADFICTKFEYAYEQNQSLEGISSSLEKIEFGNLSLEGQIDFLYENGATYDKEVIDSYKLAVHSDINPFAFSGAMVDGEIAWDKIDWADFGYLSLSLSLVEVEDEGQQNARHNGTVDYINFIIDSDKFGENMIIYSALYNPKMNLVSENYLLNNNIYLPAVMNAYSEGISNAVPDSETASLGSVVNALKGTISFIINNEAESLNEIVYKFLSSLLQNENTQEIAENLYIENGKIMLETAKVKEIISKAMTEFSSWLGYSNFTSNMLGSASHMAFDFTSVEYGKVDQTVQNSDLITYNQRHKTLTGVIGNISGIDDANFTLSDFKEALEQQIGKEKEVKGVFSDGSESETFDDYKANGQKIILTIYDIEVIEESQDSAKIRIYFTYSQNTLAQTLYNKNIPYGLIACERTIQF